MRSFPALALFLLGVAGCAEGSSGALGQTQATPECAPTDLVCAVSGLDGPLAAGATVPVDVSLTSQGSAAPPLTFVSADPAIFSIEGTRLRGNAAGVASLLVMTTGSLVVDFFHVWVAAPDALRIHRRTGEGLEAGALPERLELLVGDELLVSAEPYQGAQRLLGEPEATWAADAAVAQLLDEGTPSRRRVVARAPGSTTLEVSAFDLTATLTLEVLP